MLTESGRGMQGGFTNSEQISLIFFWFPATKAADPTAVGNEARDSIGIEIAVAAARVYKVDSRADSPTTKAADPPPRGYVELGSVGMEIAATRMR